MTINQEEKREDLNLKKKFSKPGKRKNNNRFSFKK